MATSDAPIKTNPAQQHWRGKLSAYFSRHRVTGVVMLITSSLTLAGWQVARQISDERSKERFQHRVQREQLSIQTRMQIYQQTLRGGVALFAASKEVNRSEWQSYVASLGSDNHLPGVLGIGYAAMVRPSDKMLHESAIRAEGFPHYAIQPEGTRSSYSSIIWLEPFTGRNLRAFGYDMLTEPRRRQAMEQARDSGEMALSGKIVLVQETGRDIQPGFLMYLPVYRQNMPRATPEQRRAALQGFVFSPFRAHDLMRSMFRNNQQEFDVEVFDQNTSPDAQLYDSRPGPSTHIAQQNIELPITMGGRRWIVRFHSRPEFESSMRSWLPNAILLGGASANAVLLLVLMGNRRHQQHTEAQAAALQESRERFRTLVENMPGIVFRRNAHYPWHVQHISGAIETFTGASAASFMSGANIYGHFIFADDLAEVKQVIADSVARHQSYEVEYRLCHQNGQMQWVSERGQAIYDRQGLPQSLDGVILDISIRKQAEQDLQTLTDSLPVAVYRYRREADGMPNLLYLSASIATLLGVSATDAMRNPNLLYALIHPDDLPGFLEAERQASNRQQPFTFETRVCLKGGKERWLYLSASPHAMANGEIAYNGFAEDITERKQTAQAIRETDERYRRMVETASEGIWSMDGQHRTTFVNLAMQQMLGYTATEMLGQKVESFMFPEDLAQHQQQMTGRHQGEDGRYERRFRRKDGAECWCLVSATALQDGDNRFAGSFAMFSDITAIKQAEREVAERESLLKQIFDTSSVAIFLVDKAGVIVHANQRMAEMFGYALSDLIGSLYTSHIHPSERISGQQKMLALLESGIALVDLERRYWRADGSEFWGHLTGKRLLNVMGQEMGLVGVIVDITQRRQVEDELRIAASTFQIQDGLVVTDAAGVIVRVNAAFSEVAGYSQEEAIGQTPSILNSGVHDDTFYREMWATLLSEDKWQGEIWNRRKNGEVFPEWLTITAVRDADNRISHYVGAYRDITEHKAAEEAIRNLAFYDPLTTLPNRRLLLDRLQQGIASSSRNGLHGALIFIDLDNFKTLNDTLGHDLGDLLLVEVAKRLQHNTREGDTVARLGGDEFVIMLAGLHPAVEEAAAQAEVVGDNIIQALNPSFRVGKHELRSTPSLGITLFKGSEQGIDELLKRADLAMYQAKAAGRNTLRFFDPAMQASINARVVMENELYRAIEAHEFALHYQPQLDMDGNIAGVEALIRWQNPKRGLISPAEFIPVAEETGQILAIGHWVLMQACQQLQLWQDDPLTAQLSIAVNVSAKQFRLPMFVDEVRNLIRHIGINPSRLKLELTESMLLVDVNDAIVKMGALQGMGLSFALDDFGTGYSSLAYLKKLPLDQVKIDRSFVRDVLTDANDTAICRAVIALGKSLGLAVIAEGVETASQRDFLQAEGCDFAQGYLFAKPMPPEQLYRWLQQHQTR